MNSRLELKRFKTNRKAYPITEIMAGCNSDIFKISGELTMKINKYFFSGELNETPILIDITL